MSYLCNLKIFSDTNSRMFLFLGWRWFTFSSKSMKTQSKSSRSLLQIYTTFVINLFLFQWLHFLTSCAEMTCHARREFLVPNFSNIFSVLSIFKYPGETSNKFITSQYFLSSDITRTSSKGKESDELLCTVWSLVVVRNQLQAQRG